MAVLIAGAASSCRLGEKVWIGDVAWLSDGRVYYEARINQAPNKLRSVRPGGKDVRDEQAGAGCEAEEYGLRALPNGRMAVSARCGYSGTTEVLEYDAGRTPQAERRAGSLSSWVTAVWDPGTGRGYFDARDQLSCRRLGRMDVDAASPLYVDAAGDRVRVDNFTLGEPCESDRPDASWPLPAGPDLYFFASLQAKGLRGDQRLLAPQVLYRAGADGFGHEVLGGFADVRGAALSRDGGTLVVAAKRDGDWALWRVDLPGGKVRRLADGDYSGVSIAPDGKHVAAVLSGGADDDEIRVLQL
ncbi:hypothetical protein KZZ52_35955 [Dactylosporangium sp. AC04546]|uniref:TolB family protein n=1 Tax=Dactylosporangium sp. AC04546 TaxID=2862460 RepID=UPI001EDE5E52|nr:hypothetical protein [Dactylosporangium sp. AC04546]WVK79363.1 hypothetical protein KZZ52_35955 [Dactylosporangium sp. AC04546]